MTDYSTPNPDLSEARRLHAAGMKLVKLHTNSKQPIGDEWNKHPAKQIDADATGYGLPLAMNGLCSIDPDHVEMARVGMAAWGFDLDDLMAQGVRTASTRPNSGGRAAFLADEMEMIRWLSFRVFGADGESITVLELRAKSENLQDVIPGIVYADKNTGELYSQQYANDRRFDDAPALPDEFARTWRMLSQDDDKYREYSKIFTDAIIAAGFTVNDKKPHHKPPMGSGEKLAFPAPCRRDYNSQPGIMDDILTRHSYQYHSRLDRWSHPGATGAPGIRLIPGKKDLYQSDHAGDPLHGTFDPWAAHVQLDHGGDVEAAIAAWTAAEFDRLTQEAPPPAPDLETAFTLPDYPEDLLDLPYQLGGLQAFIFGRMTYPSAATAGLAALATLTAFAQTNIVISSRDGLGFNEYYMILAPTGFGKEDLRKPVELLDRKSADAMTAEIIAEAGGGNLSGLDSVKLRHAAPASAQGVHQILEESRSVFFLADEYAEWLRQSHKDAQKQAGLGYLMQAYTKATGIIEPGHAVTQKYTPVRDPRLSILATSTSEAMFESMTREQADSGAYNRWVMFAGDTELPKKRYNGLIYEPEQALVEFIAWVKAIPQGQRVTFDADGFHAFMELDDSLAEPIKRKDGVLGGRLAEQAIKMAALIALADRRFVIQRGDMETAFKIRVGLYHRAAALANHAGSLDGMHATGQALKQVAELLRRKPGIYRSQIPNQSRRYQKLSIAERKTVIEALTTEGYAVFDPSKKNYLHSLVYGR